MEFPSFIISGKNRTLTLEEVVTLAHEYTIETDVHIEEALERVKAGTDEAFLELNDTTFATIEMNDTKTRLVWNFKNKRVLRNEADEEFAAQIEKWEAEYEMM